MLGAEPAANVGRGGDAVVGHADRVASEAGWVLPLHSFGSYSTRDHCARFRRDLRARPSVDVGDRRQPAFLAGVVEQLPALRGLEAVEPVEEIAGGPHPVLHRVEDDVPRHVALTFGQVAAVARGVDQGVVRGRGEGHGSPSSSRLALEASTERGEGLLEGVAFTLDASRGALGGPRVGRARLVQRVARGERSAPLVGIGLMPLPPFVLAGRRRGNGVAPPRYG